MQVDDLFTKIGIITVENDMLRAELNRAKERIQELEKATLPTQPQIADLVPLKE